MTRLIFAVVALLLVAGFGSPAQAYEAPWCAMVETGTGSVYEDCQYSSFEDCYRRGNILAGNRGFCTPSPYYVAGSQRQTRERHARPY